MLPLLFSSKAASRDTLPGFLEVKYTAVLKSHALSNLEVIHLDPLLLPLASPLSKRTLPCELSD